MSFFRQIALRSLAFVAFAMSVAAQNSSGNDASPITESGMWRETREINGVSQWVQVRAWRDAETESEFTIYYAEDGTPLSSKLQAEFAKTRPNGGVSAEESMPAQTYDAASAPAPKRKVMNRPPALARKSPAQVRAAVSREVNLSGLNAEEMVRTERGRREDASQIGAKRKYAGLSRSLPSSIVFLGPGQNVIWSPADDGGWVARVTLSSPGAKSIRVRWEGQDLPEGIVFSTLKADGSVYGKTLGREDLNDQSGRWAGSVLDDSTILEAYLPPGSSPTDVGPRLAVPQVAHILATPLGAKDSPSSIGEETCHQNLACQSSTWRNLGKAVASIEFLVSGSWYICTGSLLNDADPNSKPYFMTANHCVGNQTIASTIEFYWFFYSTSCNNAAYYNDPQVQHTDGGGTLLATKAGIPFSSSSMGPDFSFLLLNEQPPSGVVFAGWLSSTFSNNVSVYCIHNPAGAYMRFSEALKNDHDSYFWEVVWKVDRGITEGGSSGSPLYNGSQQFVGQLYGGYSSCFNQQGPDYYGRLPQYFGMIEGYLNGAYVATNPVSTTVNVGATTTLTVAAGNGGNQFRWYTGAPGSGTLISGATSSSYTVPAATTPGTRSFYADIRKSSVSPVVPATSTAAIITTVDVAPAFTQQPASNTNIGSGQMAQLTAVATGTNLVYQWYRGTTPGSGGVLISGATSATYTTPALTTTTSYWLRVSNSNSTVYSNLATVTVVAAPVITGQPTASTEKLAGETASFTVTASGSGLSYQWFEGNTPGSGGSQIGGATSASYTTPALTTSTGYWLRVSNVGGTVYSNLAAVTVFANAYYQWASHEGIPDSAPNLDVDFDGISNELEYILDFDPKVNSSAQLPMPQFAPGTGLPMITFPIMSGLPAGTVITVSTSIDLLDWEPANVVIQGNTVTATAGAAGDPTRYFHIQGTLP